MANSSGIDMMLLIRRKAHKTTEDFIFGLAHCKEWVTIDDICGALIMERWAVIMQIEGLRLDKRLHTKIIDGISYFKIQYD